MSKTIAITMLALLIASAAMATPVPNSAAVYLRVFNDCPFSTLTSANNYPTYIGIEDIKNSCGGGANRHAWRFSQDGTTMMPILNVNGFRFGCDVTISGGGGGEGGIGISPWWSQLVDGIFNMRTSDGEVACFGGRLPFYSFTASQGITYVKGTTVHLEIEYLPNQVTMEEPGTIQYWYDSYTSGPLAFDEGNPFEGYGSWGILDGAVAGGNFQMFLAEGAEDAGLLVTWENITFTELGDVVPVEAEAWGSIKSLFR